MELTEHEQKLLSAAILQGRSGVGDRRRWTWQIWLFVAFAACGIIAALTVPELWGEPHQRNEAIKDLGVVGILACFFLDTYCFAQAQNRLKRHAYPLIRKLLAAAKGCDVNEL